MKQFVIKEELLIILLKYLGQKPYDEVRFLIDNLSRLPEFKEIKNDKEVLREVSNSEHKK